MSRRRRIGGAVAVMLASMVIGLWFTNTESLAFPFQDEPFQLAAGGTIEVEIDIPCQPLNRIVYRPSHLGRWQETHADGESNIRRWWQINTRSTTTPSICIPGPMIIRVPDDVTADRVAVCGQSTRNCVEIIVERAD